MTNTNEMIIVMKAGAPQSDAAKIIEEITEKGLKPVPLYGTERTVIAVIGDERDLNMGHLESMPGVDKVMRVLKPYKLVTKEGKKTTTIIEVNGVKIGDPQSFAAIAGPCSVENEKQMDEVGSVLKKLGIKIMRGGAYKPRTGPYSFQGLGKEGLEMMRETANKYDLAMVTEVVDTRDIENVAQKSEMIQVGARNMQNFELLKELGNYNNPVLLKRGMSASIEEFLLAAEYILAHGNPNVILCERGIRTFETDTRNTLALATIPLIQELSHLPIIFDPTHGVGVKSLIPAMTKAGIAAGADGFIIEMHPKPEEALSDAQQQLNPKEFAQLMEDIQPILKAVNKSS